MLADEEFGLQGAGLFHGLENRHHVARCHAEGVEGGGDSFHRWQFGQSDQRGFALG